MAQRQVVRGKRSSGQKGSGASAVNWDDVTAAMIKQAKLAKAEIAFDQSAINEIAWENLLGGKTKDNHKPPKNASNGPTTDNAMRSAMLWRVAASKLLYFDIEENTLCVVARAAGATK